MKQGEHAFDVNADIEPDEDVGPDFGDNFDADVDVDEGRPGDCEEFKEHREACSKSPQKGRLVLTNVFDTKFLVIVVCKPTVSHTIHNVWISYRQFDIVHFHLFRHET